MCRRRKNGINGLGYRHKYIVYMIIVGYIQSSPDCGYLQAVNIIWKSRRSRLVSCMGVKLIEELGK